MQSKKGKIIQCHTSSISRNPHPLLWTHQATLSVLWAHQPMLFVHTIARATNVSLSHTTQFSPCLIHIIHCSPYYNSHNLMRSRVIVHHPYCPMLQILYLILPIVCTHQMTLTIFFWIVKRGSHSGELPKCKIPSPCTILTE